MDQEPLVTEQIQAGNRFLREFDRSLPVLVAFWVKPEDEPWTLYVGSDHLNGNYASAYAEAAGIAQAMREPSFDPFRIRLVGVDNPMAQAALQIYQSRSPRIPFRLGPGVFGRNSVEGVYLVKGPTRGYTMPTGREALDRIIDGEADFFNKNGFAPRKVRLPVLLAYDLAKCGRNEIGDLSGKVFKDGIDAFEKEGFHGMRVEIVRDRDAVLQFE